MRVVTRNPRETIRDELRHVAQHVSAGLAGRCLVALNQLEHRCIVLRHAVVLALRPAPKTRLFGPPCRETLPARSQLANPMSVFAEP